VTLPLVLHANDANVRCLAIAELTGLGMVPNL
jgi:hypothetical protein